MKKSEWQALQSLRTSHTGRQLQRFLSRKILEARDVYENIPADEQQRQLLVAYKRAHAILFTRELRSIN